MDHQKVFGKTLRTLRTQRHLTQEELAFESGLDRTYISLLELGHSSPTLDTLYALSGALGISLVDFALQIEAAMQLESA